MLATHVAAASASRIPTAAQSKALKRAFARDHSHPRNAAIINMRVSTVNGRWWLVRWTLPPHKASAAASDAAVPSGTQAKQPKIIVYSSTYTGSPPKPAKQPPPPKVKKDLHRGLWLRITYTGTGREDANYKSSEPMSCGGPEGTETWTDELHSRFSWTSTVEVDLDRPTEMEYDGGGDLLGGQFAATEIDPTTGHGSDDESGTYRDTSGCNVPANTACSWRFSAIKAVAEVTFDPRGAFLEPPFILDDGSSCSDGQEGPSVRSRWFLSQDLVVGVPLNVGLGGVGSTSTGPWDVSFPRSVPVPDDGVVSTTKGLCEFNEGCTDKLNWNGHVSVEVFNSGS